MHYMLDKLWNMWFIRKMPIVWKAALFWSHLVVMLAVWYQMFRMPIRPTIKSVGVHKLPWIFHSLEWEMSEMWGLL